MTAHTAATGLETEAGLAIGRDPREMSRADLESLGHGKQPLLRVIRARREAGRRLGARRAAAAENPGSGLDARDDSPPPERMMPRVETVGIEEEMGGADASARPA